MLIRYSLNLIKLFLSNDALAIDNRCYCLNKVKVRGRKLAMSKIYKFYSNACEHGP